MITFILILAAGIVSLIALIKFFQLCSNVKRIADKFAPVEHKETPEPYYFIKDKLEGESDPRDLEGVCKLGHGIKQS